MYRLTPESITTRGDLDRAVVAEERASRLAAELDELRQEYAVLWTVALGLTKTLVRMLQREAARDAVPR